MERICKHCNEKFSIENLPKGWMANHSRWCDSNPKRVEYLENLSKRTISMNISRTGISGTNQFIKAEREGVVLTHSMKGKPGKSIPHTEETKNKMRVSALKSTHRRLRKGVVFYKGVMLDSSWELSLAMRLDELSIKWIRPEPIPWIDDKNIVHNYFPDFYLEDYDVYLDPKNPIAYKTQIEKIKILNKTYNNIIWICTINECKNFII